MDLEQQLDLMISNSNVIIDTDIKDRFSVSREITRRFTVAATCDLVGISKTTMYAAIKDGRLSGELFDNWQPSTGATVYQIEEMRKVFKTHPFITKNLTECVVMAISGHKGGGWKTTTVAHQAQWLSLRGYRVLVISMDPQGSLNLMFGLLPDLQVKEEHTLLPFFYGKEKTADYAIQKTYWPTLDIIPSCLQFAKVEDEIVKLGDEDKLPHDAHLLLHEAIETVKHNYDIVLIDGAPNLGLGTVNSVFAADLIVCPSPADLLGFFSTRQYLQMLKELLQPFELDGHQPIFKILATHVDNAVGSNSKPFMRKMQAAWGAGVLKNPVIRTDQVPISYNKMRTIYEQGSSERTSWGAYKKATGIFDDVFNEVLDDLLLPMWGVE